MDLRSSQEIDCFWILNGEWDSQFTNNSNTSDNPNNDEAGVYKKFVLLMRPCPKTTTARAKVFFE